jgi:streptogramin lyase
MADSLQPGDVFAGHRIEAIAGRGGMGVVYRARHLALDHVVALKVISPQLARDERFRRRFASESRIAVSIRHPNVVSIHHAGEEDGLLFVTMDLIEGPDLRAVLGAMGRLEPEHAARIVAEVAAALDAAHARGLVHRDVKPANVLIEGEGDSERVYLTDFGLARQVTASTGVTATGAFVGTLDYVAPEQIRGVHIDARADVYALGCVLFELLTGNPPFASRENKVAKMYAHLGEEPPRVRLFRPDMPAALDPVVARALAKDPDERYPSTGDFARAVSAAVVGEPTQVAERSVAVGAAAPDPSAATLEAPGEVPAGPQPPVARRWALATAAVGALAAVVAVVVIVAAGGDDGSAPATTTSASGEEKATVVQGAIPVGKLPVSIAHGQGGLWVTNRRSDTVSLVDGRLANEVGQFAAGSAPEGIDVGRRSIWVASGGDDQLLRLDPGSGKISDRIAVGDSPGGVAFAAGDVWVADTGADTVTRYDPDTGRTQTITVGANPYGVAFGEGAVWVTNRGDDSIARITPINNRVDDQVRVGDNPKGIAVGAGAVWVANTEDGTVSQVVGGTERKEIDVGPEPRGVVAAFGSIWVSLGAGNEVARIDPEAARVVQKIPVGSGPEGIAAGPKTIWVANGIDHSLTRIAP